MSYKHLFPRGQQPTMERLLVATEPRGDCRIWTRALDSSGYGNVKVAGRTWGVHRLAYTLAYGPIPEAMTVDHVCFQPACVNPDHLRLLTHLENCSRQRSALATSCRRGHEFSDENTQWRIGANGRPWRACKTCMRASVARRRSKGRRAAA